MHNYRTRFNNHALGQWLLQIFDQAGKNFLPLAGFPFFAILESLRQLFIVGHPIYAPVVTFLCQLQDVLMKESQLPLVP